MDQKPIVDHLKERATAVIWGCAVGMFALCIPLTAVAESGPILPTLVILGAISGTVAVWVAPSKNDQEDKSAMTALEERVINLEVIYTSLPEFNAASSFCQKEHY